MRRALKIFRIFLSVIFAGGLFVPQQCCSGDFSSISNISRHLFVQDKYQGLVENNSIKRIFITESWKDAIMFDRLGNAALVTSDKTTYRGAVSPEDFGSLCNYIERSGLLLMDYRGMNRGVDMSKVWVWIWTDTTEWCFSFNQPDLPVDVHGLHVLAQELVSQVVWHQDELTEEESKIMRLEGWVDIEIKELLEEIQELLEKVDREGRMESDPGDFYYRIIDSKVAITGYKGGGIANIPSEIIGKPVVAISEKAFAGRANLRRVTIPDSVVSIGNEAFFDCASLVDLTIGGSVASIGERAFAGCAYLRFVTIPDSVVYIGSKAFFDCTRLTDVSFSSSLAFIGDMAFFGTGLTNVTIPDSVTFIGNGAFSDCIDLTSVIIGDKVTSIGDETFLGCSSLTSVTIPDSVASIGIHAFFGCVSLTNIAIPDSVVSIGDGAFPVIVDKYPGEQKGD